MDGIIWTPDSKDQQAEGFNIQIPSELPLLPTRDVVVFPLMLMPLLVGRDISINAVNEALSKDRLIFITAQKDPQVEQPGSEDVYHIGTVCMIMRMVKTSDDRIKIIVQGIARARIEEFLQFTPFIKVKIRPLPERTVSELSMETEAHLRLVKENLEKLPSLGKPIPPEAVALLSSIDDPGKLADMVAPQLNLKTSEAQEILEIIDPEVRLKRVVHYLLREVELLTLQQKIQSEAREEMNRAQREYFLREQLKAIQKELGEKDERQEEIEEFQKKIEKAKMPPEVRKEAEKQLRRLAKMHPDSAEAAVVRTYLEWLVELPWKKSTRDRLDIKEAKRILDEDHYDLEKVKERILEYLSVLKLKKQSKQKDAKGAILCFVGPPGVGKTSLGKSIARAMGRRFVRVSLGGVRDEAEIRGHRRTYVGALPGKIIQGIKQAGTNNPVFMLDEIDKLGVDFKGDPASALLEVLDPEQNHSFVDHYLGVPFDLSRVLFICTANVLHTIPAPLLDRMEVIEIPGYTEEDKLEIAKNYIIPRQLKECGLKKEEVSISEGAIVHIIRHYTREAGLRNLEKQIASIFRKIARRKAEGEKGPFRVTTRTVEKFLGPPKYLPEEEKPDGKEPGVAVGLAWTPTGGEIMHIEVAVVKGKGKLILTGQLGDVMKESAQAAVSYVRSRAKALGIDEDFYYKNDIHIHVPAGAIPKDGPSAGITIATALVSALTGVPVRNDVAMTGEITLRGRVLPIGGLREKALAARRAGIYEIIIPKKNLRDLEELPAYAKRDLKFHPVEHMDEVLKIAFTKPLGVGGEDSDGQQEG